MAQILTRLPDELKQEFQSKARQMGFTLNGLILKILWDWLREQERM